MFARLFVRSGWVPLVLLLAFGIWPIAAVSAQDVEVRPVEVADTIEDAGSTADPTADPVTDSTGERIRELALDLNSYKDGQAALDELLEMGDERVERVLRLLIQKELYQWEDELVTAGDVSQSPEGEEVRPLLDLLTGEPLLNDAGEPIVVTTKELGSVRKLGAFLVRKNADAALAIVRLKMKDPAVRKDAAISVGDTGELEALPTLREMADRDPSASVRHAAQESIQILIASGKVEDVTPEQRLEAVRELGELASLRGGRLIRNLLADPEKANLPTAPLTAVGERSLRRIDRHQTTVNWLSYAFQGLSAGSILVLLALGLAITFGVMGVINMAHGEMLMIGAVTTWASYEFLVPILPDGWGDLYYVAAFPLSFLTAALVGLLVEVTIVRWLYKRPLDSLLATIGVSFILIQAVRLWKGDNLGMSAPSWFTGGWEPYQDLILPYNRLFIITLTAACVLFTAGLFRFTRLGLMIRATVQDRETARTLGVNTRLVDMLTFAYGAGLAGLAGYAVVLLSNPTPQMGQGYIVESFLVVVVGGVGKLIGVVVSGLGLGMITKLAEPIVLIEQPLRIFDATWSQVLVLLLVIAFMQRKPAGLFPDKGRLANAAGGFAAPWAGGGQAGWKRDLAVGLILAGIGLLVVPLLYGSGYIGLGMMNKLGQFTALAMVAVGLDLLWGFMGVLSLCQYMFFALGGYCMAIYLINHGSMVGPEGNIPASLMFVMSGVGDPQPPWYLPFFKYLPIAALFGVLVPGLLALLIGLTTFRSRVRGVYFAILTQAITVAAYLIFQKSELGLGGTTGLTNFKTIMGFPIAGGPDTAPFEQTRFWLYIASVTGLLLVLAAGKAMTGSGFGRVLVAIRDDETRLLFRGYQTWIYKTAAFTAAAVFAGIGGMLYAPQKAPINSHLFAPITSILVVAWVAVGGRGTLWGGAVGTIVVLLLYDWMTSASPETWPFVLGTLFIAVPLFLPGGLMSIPGLIFQKAWSDRRPVTPPTTTRAAAPATQGAPSPPAEVPS